MGWPYGRNAGAPSIDETVRGLRIGTADRVASSSQKQTVLGRAAILKQSPHERPLRSKKSYTPLFHAPEPEGPPRPHEGYRAFVEAFREAAARLRTFPAGSFPPALPFVGG